MQQVRNLVKDLRKKVKRTQGQGTPEIIRRREPNRPDITLGPGGTIRLTEAHIHGEEDEEPTNYLAIKVTETRNGQDIVRPKKGDAVVQVFCDCEYPELEDITRTAIAVPSNGQKRDKTTVDALKTNKYRPVNQRGISLHHPDDELINEDKAKPDLLVSIPEQVDKMNLNDPNTKQRMIIWIAEGDKELKEGEEEDLEEMAINWTKHTTQETKAILFRLHQEKFQGATNIFDCFLAFNRQLSITNQDLGAVEFNIDQQIKKNEKEDDEDYVGILLEPIQGATRATLLKEGLINQLEEMYNDEDTFTVNTIRFELAQKYGLPARCKISYKPKTQITRLRPQWSLKHYDEFLLPKITFIMMEYEILNTPGVKGLIEANADVDKAINLMRNMNLNKQDYIAYKEENKLNEEKEKEKPNEEKDKEKCIFTPDEMNEAMKNKTPIPSMIDLPWVELTNLAIADKEYIKREAEDLMRAGYDRVSAFMMAKSIYKYMMEKEGDRETWEMIRKDVARRAQNHHRANRDSFETHAPPDEQGYHRANCPSSLGGSRFSMIDDRDPENIDEEYREHVFDGWRKQGFNQEEMWKKWMDHEKRKMEQEKKAAIDETTATILEKLRKSKQRLNREAYEYKIPMPSGFTTLMNRTFLSSDSDSDNEDNEYKVMPPSVMREHIKQGLSHDESRRKWIAEVNKRKQHEKLVNEWKEQRHHEVKDKNLAKTVRVKRLTYKKLGSIDKGPVELSYCYNKYENVFSDSEEDEKTKRPLKAKPTYHRRTESHKKNIQWLNKLSRKGIMDIGLRQPVDEIARKLEHRLANGEEEHQKDWKEAKEMFWASMDETGTQRKEAYERPERVNHGRNPPNFVTVTTAEEEQPRPETGGQESRIRRPAFNIELWEVPAHIEAIPEAARQGHQDYEDWKEMVKSRGDIKDHPPRFEYLLPHFKKGYREAIQGQVERSELKGMDYVDRETKAWHEALKKARALNPWVSTGKEFKPSIDQDYGDLMRAQNGGKVFAALRDRTPRLPGAKTNSSTTFEINNQFKIWRVWALKEGIPWTSFGQFIYRAEIIGTALFRHVQQKLSAFPNESLAIEQLSTYLEDQMCYTTKAEDDNYDESREQVLKEHTEKLTGPHKSTKHLRATFPTDVKKLMAMHSNYRRLETEHLGNIPENETKILHDLIEHQLIREIITRAGLKPDILELYVNVANTAQKQEANWDTRGWQDFAADLELVFKVHKEQTKNSWRVNRVLEEKVEQLQIQTGQLQDKMKAQMEHEEAVKAANWQSPKRQKKKGKPQLRGSKRKMPKQALDPKLEEICENCIENYGISSKSGISSRWRIRNACERKGHCLQHGYQDCQKTKQCRERNRTKAIKVAMTKLEESGISEQDIEIYVKDGVCILEDDICRPDTNGEYEHGYHRNDCPAHGHIEWDPRDDEVYHSESEDEWPLN